MKEKHRSTRLIFLLLIVFLLCSYPGKNVADESPIEGNDLIPWQILLNQYATELNAPGGLLGVLYPDGRRHIFTYGKANLVDNIPMGKNFKFRVGSITKTFTSTVVLQLAQEGHFSLDDPAQDYFPAWLKETYNFKGVTIRQLLNHTSCLQDYASSLSPDFTMDTYIYPLKTYSHRSKIKLAFDQDGGWMCTAPSKDCHYSNTNYELLGILIEHVTQSSLEEQFKQRFFNNPHYKFKLPNSSFPSCACLPHPFVHGYNDLNLDHQITANEDVSILSTTAPWSAGALISNIDDLLTWFQAVIDGTLLKPSYQQERFTYVCKGRDEDGNCNDWYGLGIESFFIGNVQGQVPAEFEITGHLGILNGYWSIAGRLRAGGDTYIIAMLLNNCIDPPAPICKGVISGQTRMTGSSPQPASKKRTIEKKELKAIKLRQSKRSTRAFQFLEILRKIYKKDKK